MSQSSEVRQTVEKWTRVKDPREKRWLRAQQQGKLSRCSSKLLPRCHSTPAPALTTSAPIVSLEHHYSSASTVHSFREPNLQNTDLCCYVVCFQLNRLTVRAWAHQWIISMWERMETAPFKHGYLSPLETLQKRTHLWTC